MGQIQVDLGLQFTDQDVQRCDDLVDEAIRAQPVGADSDPVGQ
jgi:hypothetical protein